MLVKVYIKRHIKQGKEKDFFKLLRKLRSKAMHHDGYITGETLINTENPQIVMVVSCWKSMENWESWKNNPTRKEFDDLLEKMQTSPTAYEAYAYSKYRVFVQKGFPSPPSSI